ncbi:BZ3500_MvSof-1268-A1-R1_Chr1-1g01047 [Microbotryum saponariae]|uniref:lipoyl(octanoyl) transferase n=1 Tax=Microbotryum saponariae TaxID=289078 RepID=A0A2X0MBQ7_9BASI|nr:BZ3500_MvSof-1268-A1-R1_Chr1-1g01047 [Microbotryum saponariae]SCZ93287.1 BZ3501_MvSof-1269-A2-R1_Chr1-1g00644 [Microbotryum saponariae]
MAAAAVCSSSTRTLASSARQALTPIRWTYLPDALPYSLGLLLQESIVASRWAAKSRLAEANYPSSDRAALERIAHTDVLLLLQHKPVFTAGRRETDPEALRIEGERLTKQGADYVSTMRGGQTTYHGPGQLVGYSLMDLVASDLSTRCYVDHLEKYLETLARLLGVPVYPLEHTGVFTSPTLKIGSIGIHMRHRISLHGFAINVEEQTRRWFDMIVACGLDDVKATSAQAELSKLKSKNYDVKVEDLVPTAAQEFGKQYGRGIEELKEGDEFVELRKMIDDGVKGKLPPLKDLGEKKVAA